MALPPPPIVDGLAGKIATLDRRRSHLETRIAEGRRGSSTDFDKAEASALRAAIDCMRYVDTARGGT